MKKRSLKYLIRHYGGSGLASVIGQKCSEKMQNRIGLHPNVNQGSFWTPLLADKPKPDVINWQQCLQKVSNKADLAEEFLNKFMEELHKNREEFCLFWHHKNIKGLADVAHKLKGACYFCGVPLLQTKVTYFEKLASSTNQIEELTAAYAELMQSMDALTDEYNNHYFRKTKEKECL